MRAEFTDLVTLYDGPTTALPGFPRVVRALCRNVPDPWFVDTREPFGPGRGYFTINEDEPLASVNTQGADGIWSFDFGKADRAEFDSSPGVRWAVVRVEACTWPDDGAPYWRASYVRDTLAASNCSVGYWQEYEWTDEIGIPIARLVRTGPTTWVGGGWIMRAETDELNTHNCESRWVITGTEGQWANKYSGTYPTVMFGVSAPSTTRFLNPKVEH